MSDLVRFHDNDSALVRALRLRAGLLARTRAFFADRGFVEVETPIVCSSPGVETHLAALETRAAGRTMYLTTSPEFHMKRLVAVGMDRIFQVTRAFRGGEVGDRHNPEFAMVEWYRVGVDYRAIMDDCEALLRHLAEGLALADLTRPGPYPRTTFDDAFGRAGLPEWRSLDFDDRILALAEKVEPLLAREGPEFLIDYPVDQASLAQLRPTPDAQSVAERFELYARGLELANGFTEVTDADEYIRRCDADLAERDRLGLPRYPVDERYVSMLRDGIPPCAGVALGFDRVVMLLAGTTRIRDVMAFPIDLA